MLICQFLYFAYFSADIFYRSLLRLFFLSFFRFSPLVLMLASSYVSFPRDVLKASRLWILPDSLAVCSSRAVSLPCWVIDTTDWPCTEITCLCYLFRQGQDHTRLHSPPQSAQVMTSAAVESDVKGFIRVNAAVKTIQYELKKGT